MTTNTAHCQLQPGAYCEQPAAGPQLSAMDRAMMIDPMIPATAVAGVLIIAWALRKLIAMGSDFTRSVEDAAAAVQAEARTTDAIASAGPAPRAADAADVADAAENLRTTVQAARSARAQAMLDDLDNLDVVRTRRSWAETRPL